jgi:signal transduction histidine kinase
VGAVSADERERVRALQSLGLLDTVEEQRFDRITAFAAEHFHVPISLISLVDAGRQWFKSHHGLDLRETPRAWSFCAHAIRGDETFVVRDAQADPRFADNELVTGPPHIRFYAGHPLVDPRGHHLGTINVIDRAPRDFSAADSRVLQALAQWVESEIALIETTALRDAARHAGEARTRFLARLAHELRTPLNAVYGNTQLLEMQLVAKEDLAPTVDRMMRSCRRLIALIDELIDVSLLDSDRAGLMSSAVAVAPLVHEAVDHLVPDAERRGVTLVVDPSLDELTVHADERRLVHVLTNLTSNAVQYNRPGGMVTVAGRDLGDDVMITVTDTGAGIGSADLARIFEPFDRVDVGDEREHGPGLGLTIARTLAELMHGSLTASSTPGEGSTFALTLPKPDVGEVEAPALRTGPSARGPGPKRY